MGLRLAPCEIGQLEDMPREGRRYKRQFFFGLLQHGNGKDRNQGFRIVRLEYRRLVPFHQLPGHQPLSSEGPTQKKCDVSSGCCPNKELRRNIQ